MKLLLSFLFLLPVLGGCVRMKPTTLYEQPSDEVPMANINGFYAISLFSDQINSELWYTVSPKALQVSTEKTEVQSGSGAISLEWNKQADPSTWLGMGIGWDNWTGKDMSAIQQSAAISFWVKMKKGQSSGLPWAIGFEDFSGGQAWTGVTVNYIQGGVVKDQWTQVIIPLSAFPFEGYDVDVTNIKQLIFQFESSGKVWIDDIRFIPYTAVGRKSVSVNQMTPPVIDGVFNSTEWSGTGFQLTAGTVYLNWDDNMLYLAAVVKDQTPFINTQTGKDIWNGDALEIAFSTTSGVSPKRTIFYPSDHHLGFQLGSSYQVFDWATGNPVSNIIQKSNKTQTGYSFEAAIPWSAIGAKPWITGLPYDLELALDLSDASGKRESQSRWNSITKEGFNSNPALWGTLITQP